MSGVLDRATDALIVWVRRLAPTTRTRVLNDLDDFRVYLSRRRGDTNVSKQAAKFRYRFDTSRVVGVPWWTVQPREIEDYRDALVADGVTPQTVNSRLRSVRGVLEECWRLGQIDRGHIDRIRGVRAVRGRPMKYRPAPTWDEVTAALVAIEDSSARGIRDRAILAALAGAGLRREELAVLNAGDVGIRLTGRREGQASILVRYGKGCAPRVAWVDIRFAAYLLRWCDLVLAKTPPPHMTPADMPLFVGFRSRGRLRRVAMTARDIYRVVRRRTPWTPHELRAAYATELAAAGTTDLMLSALMGHASIETTRRYVRP